MKRKLSLLLFVLLLLTSISARFKWKPTHEADFTGWLSGNGEVKRENRIVFANPLDYSFTLTFSNAFPCDNYGVCMAGETRTGHLSISNLNRQPQFYFGWTEVVPDIDEYSYKLKGTGDWQYHRKTDTFTFYPTGQYLMERYRIENGAGVWDPDVWVGMPEVFSISGTSLK